MAFDFPSSPTTGQIYGAYTYNGYAWVLSGQVTPNIVSNAGRLTLTSSTALKFAPFNGDQIKINGVSYSIPAAGIAGLANTGVFVNGTAGQNLAANTSYFVYAFNNAGTVTADYSTTGHATSSTAGNVGTEIKSATDSRSLIGLIRTNASAQFVDSLKQRFVRSWFNKVACGGNSILTSNPSTSSGTPIELSSADLRLEFLLWANEIVRADFRGLARNSTAAAGCYNAVAYDGTTPERGITYGESPTGFALWNPVAASNVKTGLSEGYHYITAVGYVNGGTGTWQGSASDTSACSIHFAIM